MPRATRIVLTLAAICGAVSILVPNSAVAAPRGTLTGPEFKQLSTATAKLDRSATAKSINWVMARGACRKMGVTTPLLRGQRTSCLDSMSALEALAKFPSEQARCAAAATSGTGATTTGTTTTTATGTTPTGTGTTGTTTTTTESGVIRLIVCLSPRYDALRRYANALYRADATARRQALTRGFTGTCLATLASTPADLGKERAFATSSAKLAKDVALLIKVIKSKAPASDLNQVQIDSDVTRFESSARAVLEEHGPQKLAACPHE